MPYQHPWQTQCSRSGAQLCLGPPHLNRRLVLHRARFSYAVGDEFERGAECAFDLDVLAMSLSAPAVLVADGCGVLATLAPAEGVLWAAERMHALAQLSCTRCGLLAVVSSTI
jgi:hypothetical protein